jgi:hypothetical protein
MRDGRSPPVPNSSFNVASAPDGLLGLDLLRAHYEESAEVGLQRREQDAHRNAQTNG